MGKAVEYSISTLLLSLLLPPPLLMTGDFCVEGRDFSLLPRCPQCANDTLTQPCKEQDAAAEHRNGMYYYYYVEIPRDP